MANWIKGFLGTKRAITLGWICFGLSCLAWPLAAGLPFLDLSLTNAEKTGLSVGVIVMGEGLFVVAGLLLGKAILNQIKAIRHRVVAGIRQYWAGFGSTTPVKRWFRLFRWVGVPLLGVFAFGLITIMSPEDGILWYYKTYGWHNLIADLLSCMVVSVLIFEGGRWLNSRLDHQLPWSERPIRRMLTQFGLQLLLAFSVVLAVFYFWDFVYNEQETTPDYIVVMSLIVGSLLSVLVTAIYVAINSINNWKQALTQAEQLKRESVEARFEVLKSQLDPHFLFNNLNTLTYLVEDNPKAVAFVENLSLVYRYILQNRDKTLVPLTDELRLADAYVFLLRQRFGDALQIHNDIPDFFRDRLIPPMALQLLLENAVKHNIVDTDRPLHVRLYCTDAGNLVVQNNLQRRAGLPGKAGVGLQNICHRYELLTTKRPVIQEKTGRFVVTLPLLRAT